MIPPRACNDGIDNDGDGLIDYPEDPGCLDSLDSEEGNLPFCGISEDGQAVFNHRLPPTAQVVESTAHGLSHETGSCGGLDANEIVYALTVTDSATSILISTMGDPTLLNTVVYVRKDHCEDPLSEVACSAGAGPGGGGQQVILEHPAPGEYFIFVDGAEPGAAGQFLLRVRWIIPEAMECLPDDPLRVCVPGLICVPEAPGLAPVCSVPRCNDGLDNDGDGLIDFLEDPGCQDPLDNTELDDCLGPGFGPGCPACADGIDNDGDGLTDWSADPDCSGAGGLLEELECVLDLPIRWLPQSGTVTGVLYQFDLEQYPFVAPSLSEPSCDSNSWSEDVYALWLPSGAARLQATLIGEEMTPQLYVRRDSCSAGVEIASDCVFPPETTASVDATSVGPGVVFVFADANDITGRWGALYSLYVTATLSASSICDPFSSAILCPAGTACVDLGEGYRCR
ncbi:MAG: hypothetical protein ABI333_14935 [bacterium]